MKTKIYTLCDELGRVRYVGKTILGLDVRLYRHLYHAPSRHYHKDNWISSMIVLGNKPTIKQITEVDGDGCEAEIFYIAWFRMLGADLTNISNGGDGGFTSEQSRKAHQTMKKSGMDKLRIQKSLRTKMKNGTTGMSLVVRAKTLVTRKSRELYSNHTPESIQRGIETKRRNGTLRGVTSKTSQKIWENRRKNGTDRGWKMPPDAIAKRLKTEKENGTLARSVECRKKMSETRRRKSFLNK